MPDDLFYRMVRHILVGVLTQEEGLGPVKNCLEGWHAGGKDLQKTYLGTPSSLIFSEHRSVARKIQL